jgi:hypothetical protein
MGQEISTQGDTDRQDRLIDALLSGKSDHDAMTAAGYLTEAGMAAAMRSERVQHGLRGRRTARITGALASKAMEALDALLGPSTPAATRFAASKWVLEQSGFGQANAEGADKPLHAMTEDELLAVVAKAQKQVDRGGLGPLIDITPRDGVE